MSNQLLVVKKEYVELVAAKCQQLNKRTQECAAKLIHYFLNWTSWKKTVHRTEWVYQKLKQIYTDFFGLHSLHCIRAAIAGLIEAGILERRNNPGNLQDKTYQYRVNMAALNTAESITEPEDSELNSEDSTVENHTDNQSIESNQKIGSKPEKKEKKEGGEIPKESQLHGYTLEHLQWLYPNRWREAAAHFGIAIADNKDTPSCDEQARGEP